MAPGQIKATLVSEAHCNKLFGHDKANKTSERLLEALFWPGLISDTIDFIRECEICIRNRKKSNTKTAYLIHSEIPS